MSNLKISEDLYTGKQELIKLQKFLGINGYRQMFQRFINTYGVSLDNAFPFSLQVVNGNTVSFVSIKAGALVDQNAETGILLNDYIDAYKIPIGSVYYIYAKRDITNQEVGTVSIDTLGNVTGVGTKFTEVLRGNPSNSTKVRFINSNFNTLDYEVINVLSDTQMVVQAPTFTSEINLKYGVVGTFSPGVVISPTNKMVYEYDTITFSLSTNANLNGSATTPWFHLASVIYDGTNMLITDLRQRNELSLLLDPSIRENGTIALINKINIFSKTQTWSQGSQTAVISKKINLPGDGNSYVVGMQDTELRYIQDQPLGTIITLAFLDNNVGPTGAQTLIAKLLMRDSSANTAPTGYRPIKCFVDNLAIVPFDTLVFERLTISHTNSPTALFDGWVMVSNSESYPLALDAETKVTALVNAAWTDYQFVASDMKTGQLQGSSTVSAGSGWFKYKVLAKILTGNAFVRFTVGTGVSDNILSLKLPNGLKLTDSMTFGQRAAAICVVNGTEVVPVEVVSQRGAAYNSYLNIIVRDRTWVYGQTVELSFSFSFEVGESTYVPPANQPPVANDLTMTVSKNSYVNPIDFTSEATGNYDPDGVITNLNIVIITQPTKGNVNRNILATDTNGNPTSIDFEYVPFFGQTGADTFTYKIVDNLGASSEIKTYTVNIQVNVNSYYSVVAPQSAGSSAVCYPTGSLYPNIPIYTSSDGVVIGNTVYTDSNLVNPVVSSYFKIGTTWYLTDSSGVITSSGACATAGNFVLMSSFNVNFLSLSGTNFPVFHFPTPINGNESANFTETIPYQSFEVEISVPSITVRIDVVVNGITVNTRSGITDGGVYNLVLPHAILPSSTIQIQINT